jgi:hypothetical protein
MDRQYHIEISNKILGERFSPRAMQVILKANLGQDNLRGQLFHPEYHFDDNLIAEGNALITQERQLAWEALGRGQALLAWGAFGCLAHAIQDFYAHSNYVRLWLNQVSRGRQDLYPEPQQIDPLDERILGSPRLVSGRFYAPWELLSFVPVFEPLMRRLLPPDSHTHMNLDGPRRGRLFAYAYEAACKRTAYELEQMLEPLSPDARAIFLDEGGETTDDRRWTRAGG